MRGKDVFGLGRCGVLVQLAPETMDGVIRGARRALQGVVCLAEPDLSGRDPHPGTDCQDLLSMSWAWRRPVVVADHCRQPRWR